MGRVWTGRGRMAVRVPEAERHSKRRRAGGGDWSRRSLRHGYCSWHLNTIPMSGGRDSSGELVDVASGTQVSNIQHDDDSDVASLLEKLIDAEKRIDLASEATLRRAREAIARPTTLRAELRVFVSHVAATTTEKDPLGGRGDGVGGVGGGGAAAPGRRCSWRLRIGGELLRGGSSAAAAGAAPSFADIRAVDMEAPSYSVTEAPTAVTVKPGPHFGGVVDSISVRLLDGAGNLCAGYGDRASTEWVRGSGVLVDSDGVDVFELQRDSALPCTAHVTVARRSGWELFRLSDALGHVVGAPTASRRQVLTAVWDYIRRNGLMTLGSDTVTLDPTLSSIFGVGTRARLILSSLRTQVNKLATDGIHMTKAPDIELKYKVDFGASGASEQCWVVQAVEVPDPTTAHWQGVILRSESAWTHTRKEDDLLRQRMASVAAAVRASKRKRALCAEVERDPSSFRHVLEASQSSDLQTICADLGDVGRDILSRDDALFGAGEVAEGIHAKRARAAEAAASASGLDE